MISQFVDKLVHLERSGNGLNKTGAPDSASGHANGILSHTEDIIPQSGLQITFHFRKVEVRSVSGLDQFMCVMEEIETKVEKTGTDGFRVDEEMFLI